MSDNRHVAIHEAKHAVIGRAVTILCGGATIVPNNDLDADGHAEIGSADMAFQQWELREKWREYASACRGRAVTAMAGREAEAEILGRVQGDDEADRAVVAAELSDICATEASEDGVEARLRRATRQLVRRHRADIERVAAALEAHETLSGEAIDAILPGTFIARLVTWALASAEA